MDAISKWLKATLNIRDGEGLGVSLMLLFSFLMGGAVAGFYTVATSLFVENYSKELYPLAYIISGFVGYLLYLGSSWLEPRVSTSKLLAIYLVFLAISIAVFALGGTFANSPLLAFSMFVWIRVTTYVTSIAFWVTASKLFDLRQGKRLFGLIGAGEVLSDVVTFFSIPLLLTVFRAVDILYVALASMVAAVIVYFKLQSTFRHRFDASSDKRTDTGMQHEKSSKPKSLLVLLKDKYILLIFALTMFPMFGIYFLDYIFLVQVKIEYPSADVLAHFIGLFFGMVAIVELILKAFVSGRLLDRYGVLFGIVSLPLMLLVASVLAGGAGLIEGQTGLFFSFIAFGKLLDRSLRASLNEPTFQTLFQAIPAEDRTAFQTTVEGFPKAVGNIAAGLVLIGFGYLGINDLMVLNYILIAVLAVWIFSGFRLGTEYSKTLRSAIDSAKQGSEAHKYRDGLAFVFERSLKTVNKETSELLKRIWRGLEPVSFFNWQFGSAAWKAQQGTNLRDELSDLEELAKVAKSKDPDERAMAARLLAKSGRFKANYILQELMEDPLVMVRRSAIVSGAFHKRPEHWQKMLQALSNPHVSHTAITALVQAGPAIVSQLDVLFNRSGQTRLTMLNVVRLMEKIGGRKVISLLRDKINHPDREVRSAVIHSLGNLGYHSGVTTQVAIKNTMIEEISAYFWVLASIRDLRSTQGVDLIVAALNADLSKKKQRIFDCLSVLYDKGISEHVKSAFEYGDEASKGFATEMLDTILSSEVKEILKPLLIELSPEELLEEFALVYPQPKLSVEERLGELLAQDIVMSDRWLKACVLRYIREKQIVSLVDFALALLSSKDPFVSEAALETVRALDRDWEHTTSIRYRLFPQVSAAIQRLAANSLSSFDKALALSSPEGVFSDLELSVVADLALLAKIREFTTETTVKQMGEPFDEAFFVIRGRLFVDCAGENDFYVEPGRAVDPLFVSESDFLVSEITASPGTLVLSVECAEFYDILAANTKAALGYTNRVLELNLRQPVLLDATIGVH